MKKSLKMKTYKVFAITQENKSIMVGFKNLSNGEEVSKFFPESKKEDANLEFKYLTTLLCIL